MGETDRPAGHPQDSAVRATQPCEVVAGRRGVEAATQPRDGCAADVKNWSRRRTHSDQSLHRTRYGGVPTNEPASGERCSTPRPAHAAGRRLSLRGRPSGERGSILPVRPLGSCSESEGSILCSRSRIRGTGTLQVSRRETLEKPETASIIARTTERTEGFGGGNRPPESGLLAAV